MNVNISRIIDRGNIDNERIVIKILSATDIGRFAVFRTGKNNNSTVITNKVYNTYWFPDGPVQTGDLIVLYTKSGVASSTRNTNGTTTRFYYWGLLSAIWSSNVTHGTVLVSIPEWQVKMD